MRIALLSLSLFISMSASRAFAQETAPSSEAVTTSASAYAEPLSRREQTARDGVPAHDRTNWNLVAPGIALLAGGWAVGWLTTVIWNVASVSCTGSLFSTVAPLSCTTLGPYGEGAWQMAIPIVGPWLTFIGDDTYRGGDIVFPVAMGLMQPIGLVLLIAGLTSPEHVAARAPTAGQVDVRVGLSSMSLDVHF
jgi:hypothetical protein